MFDNKILKAAKQLVEQVEFDVSGHLGQGGNGGLIGDQTLLTAGKLRNFLSSMEKDARVTSEPFPFNRLSPAEAERLAMLAEEAAEVVHAVGKVLRHGYEGFHPKYSEIDNRTSLSAEIGDFLAIVQQMKREGDLNTLAINESLNSKTLRSAKFTHHQVENGTE